jgi:glycosyltransferase involved in cell wall biosynthesis
MRAIFVMEQHLGHRTFCQNLRRVVEAQGADCDGAEPFEATWVDVTYREPGGFYERLAFLPETVRGTLRGRAQVRGGLRGSTAAVRFFNTQVPAVIGGRLAQRPPYVLGTDITPIQYDRMAGHYRHTADRPGPLRAYKHRVNRRVFRGAAAVVPWSTWTRRSLVDDYGVPVSRITVIPPGIDLDLWQPAAERDAAAGDGDKRHFRILFVAGDLHRKGGDVLLQAFQGLRAVDKGVELHVVTHSTPPQGEGIVARHDLDPNTPGLIAVFRSCDVFVLPTEAEAFGIAAVEAAASGLPALVTDVGGLTDVVSDGETGFIIRPGDVQTLVTRLRLLRGDPPLRARMGCAARFRAEQRFDARKNGAAIMAIMRAAVASGG